MLIYLSFTAATIRNYYDTNFAPADVTFSPAAAIAVYVVAAAAVAAPDFFAADMPSAFSSVGQDSFFVYVVRVHV